MHFGFAPLLGRHRIFHSSDTEEARAFLQNAEFRLEWSCPHHEFREWLVVNFSLAQQSSRPAGIFPRLTGSN